ncbi:MAG: hypothetical protein WCP73_03830 [Eubacteriales bacterium]
MYCIKCGSVLSENSNKCSACGFEFKDKQKSTKPNYTSIIIFGGLFLLFILIGCSKELRFASPEVFYIIFTQSLVTAAAALGIIITGRAGGIDFSIPNQMLLTGMIVAFTSSSSGSPVAGLLISLIVCIAFGFFNGTLVAFVKLPAIFTTLITAIVCYAITNAIANGNEYGSKGLEFINNDIVYLIAAAAAFCIIFFTPLGIPFSKRTSPDGIPKKWMMLASVFCSIFAFTAGVILIRRINTAATGGFIGINDVNFSILFAMFLAGTNKHFDNRIAPVPVTFLACFFLLFTNFFFDWEWLPVNTIYYFTLAYLIIAIVLDKYYSRNIFSFIKRQRENK